MSTEPHAQNSFVGMLCTMFLSIESSFPRLAYFLKQAPPPDGSLQVFSNCAGHSRREQQPNGLSGFCHVIHGEREAQALSGGWTTYSKRKDCFLSLPRATSVVLAKTLGTCCLSTRRSPAPPFFSFLLKQIRLS